jgi:hypothetical protein
MAVKGPLLRSAATQDGLWARAIDVVVPTGAAAHLKASEVSSPLSRASSHSRVKVATTHAVAADAFRTYHTASKMVGTASLPYLCARLLEGKLAGIKYPLQAPPVFGAYGWTGLDEEISLLCGSCVLVMS